MADQQGMISAHLLMVARLPCLDALTMMSLKALGPKASFSSGAFFRTSTASSAPTFVMLCSAIAPNNVNPLKCMINIHHPSNNSRENDWHTLPNKFQGPLDPPNARDPQAHNIIPSLWLLSHMSLILMQYRVPTQPLTARLSITTHVKGRAAEAAHANVHSRLRTAFRDAAV